MSQQSFHRQEANGSNIAFTITTFSEDEIKVYVDGVESTNGGSSQNDYTIPNYSTTGGTVTWNTSGSLTAPASPSIVRVVRQTDVMNNGNTAVEGKSVFQPGSSIKAEDLNNNTKQALRAIKEKQDQLIQRYDIQDGEVVRSKIAADAIDGTKIADDSINSEHYAAGSIDLEHMSANSIDSDQYVDGSIDLEHMSANSVDSDQYVDGSIDRVHLASGIIDGSKIDSDAVDSVHIAAGAVDLEHMSANSVDSDQYVDGSIDGVHIGNDQINSQHYVPNSIDNEHLALNSVTRDRIVNDAIDQTKIDADAINSTHYQDGSINRVHLEADIIDSTKLADNAVSTEHIATGSITSAKLSSDAVITASEQGSATTNDTSFLTSAAADARFFNISSGDTIKDGQTFPDNDTTIATTAAINDRIVDIVDAIGGFVPLVDEGEIPQYHPEKENAVTNDRVGTILSIGTLTTTYTPSGGTVTIQASDLTNHSVNATITDCGSTVLSAGFGVLVETKAQTDAQYAAGPSFKFHRLVPKATEVTTVAGKATEIGLLGTAAVIEDMGILGTADVVADLAILGTNDVVADLNTLGTADVVADLNTLGTADVVADMNILGTSANVTAMSNCSGSISSINNASSNLNSINNFGDKYQVASSNPSTDGGGNSLAAGDLYFNTSANELKVYTGSAWVSGVTQTGNFALTTGNTFTGNNIFTAHNTYNDNVKLKIGSSSDLEIYHDGVNGSYLDNTTGTADLYIRNVNGNSIYLNPRGAEQGIHIIQDSNVKLYFDNSARFETTSYGAKCTGRLAATTSFTGGDSVKIKLGDGDDLQIYHTADTASYITNTGLLNVNGTTGVHLQYNGTARVQTTSSGTSIQGASILNGAVTFMSTDASTAYHFNAGNGSAARFKASDNAKIVFGADEDLQIYYDGYNPIINAGTDTLRIVADNIHLEAGDFGDEMLRCNHDGAVELYYDNSKKFETTSTGATVTGILRADEIRMGDSGGNTSPNERVRLGNSEDLQIYHDGTNSYLANSTGVLRIRSDDLRLQSSTGEEYFYGVADGGAHIYHNNALRIQTTSSGISVTGDVIASGNIKTSADLSGSGGLIATGASDDLGLWHDGTNSYIRNTANAGELRIRSHQTTIRNADDNETQALFHENAAVELYYDNSKKLETSSTGITVTGDVDPSGDVQIGGDFKGPDNSHLFLGTGQDINIYHDGTDSYFYTGAGTTTFRSAANEKFADFIPDGNVKLFYDHSEKFRTVAGGVTVYGYVNIEGGSSGQLYLQDNGKINLGSQNDFQAFHNGSSNNTEINHSNDSGHMQIASNRLKLTNYDGPETYIDCISNGAVELYYDASKKLETQTQGVYIAGSLGVSRSGTPRAFNHASSGVTATKFEVDAGDSSNTTHETACFRGGADGNDAAARVRICHSGDRGMVLTGGRTSNAAFGKIGITDQNGDITTSVHINSSGTWFWGKTSQSSGTAGVELYKDGPNFMTRNGTTVLGLNCQNGTNGDIMRFYFQDVHKGSLNFSSGSFSATTASDYRLKENDTPITDGIARIKQLRPVTFNWKASYEDPTKTHDGFIAHELQAVMPDCVTGEKDGEITAKGEGYQAVSREGLIPVLTAALKDAISKIEILETKVAALEAA